MMQQPFQTIRNIIIILGYCRIYGWLVGVRQHIYGYIKDQPHIGNTKSKNLQLCYAMLMIVICLTSHSYIVPHKTQCPFRV